MPDVIFTVGHSTHSIEKLISLLISHSISAICDVRSKPYSRVNPQFNKDDFKAALKKHGIGYVFLGKELGARSDDPACYKNGVVQYDLLAKTVDFQSGIDRLIDGAHSHTIALVCAEKDPMECHRAILVSRHLAKRGMSIQHILADGSLESQDELVGRLIKKHKLAEDMFRSHEEIVEDAYSLQGGAIAYEEHSPNETSNKLKAASYELTGE